MQEMLMNSEKQLKIQTKVNEEVKRLLVASVGEDIEARVEFLTQDKARLAADVLEYNNRIAIDWERKEELGVEKDVWRSKFLASTVIVDELTRHMIVFQAEFYPNSLSEDNPRPIRHKGFFEKLIFLICGRS